MGVEVEVKSTSSAAHTGGPAAAPPAKRSGVRVVVAVVGARHYVTSFGDLSKRFGSVFCWYRSAIFVVMVVVAVSVYILFVAVCGTVGVEHRSRVGWWRGVAGDRRGIFLGVFRYDGWNRIILCRYVSIFIRIVVL